MTVLFLHGLGVKPAGIKPTFLRAQGFEVVEPILPHGDFQESVEIAQRVFDETDPRVVVGDCRGAAVALALHSDTTPQVLIAPAWRKWGNVCIAKAATVILHSELDATIPFRDSQELVRRSALQHSALCIVGKDHFMEDDDAVNSLIVAVNQVTHHAMTSGALHDA